MKIISLNNLQITINNQSRPQLETRSLKPTSFSGLRSSGKSLFVLDLDGSFLHGLTPEKLNEFLELQKKANAILAYATGQNLQKFTETISKYANKGISLPTPEFLLARNGLFIYKKRGDKLVENQEWKNQILNSFNKDKILTSVKKLAFHPDYLMPNTNKNSVINFNNSKLCEYEFWGAPGRMLQFATDSSISDTILQTLRTHLKNNKINSRVMKQSFSREVCDRLCTQEQLAIINPRYGKDNKMTQIDILAANKGDAELFIQSKLNIPDSEILMAGNDENDISMAKLSKNSEKTFICLDKIGELFSYVNNLITHNTDPSPNVIKPKNEGICGIIESIKMILNIS